MEGFNRRFNELIKNLPQDIKPPEKAILIFYIQAFEGEMRYPLRDKEPTNVREVLAPQQLPLILQKIKESSHVNFCKYLTFYFLSYYCAWLDMMISLLPLD